ncbi:hypothetical protein [Streptomyces sp. NPDC049585]|uniref:hypothetical protein n=1 Tax=Streptomyces sp. NPDC049585 TaxID=3155154 RepID=UPI00342753F2
MIRRPVLRALTTAVATAALALTATQVATAATPAVAAAKATQVDDNPFKVMDLDGLRAEYRFMCPAGHCVGYWSLVLTDEVARKRYAGGEFFVYAPAKGDFGFFLDGDIATRTVKKAAQVRIIDSEFTRTHPRFEVRYGNPEQPKKARVVATSTIWMR